MRRRSSHNGNTRYALAMLRICAAIGAAILLAQGAAVQAHETYGESGSCDTCHGDFLENPYVSLSDGSTWSDSLHERHQFMLTNECDACHAAGGRTPVFLASSRGGFNLPAIGCAGCHGRAEDLIGSGTEGYSAGLRQRHFNAGEMQCVSCHADSNPANKTVAGENIIPEYYQVGDPISYPNMPTDPCNPSPDFNENFDGTTIGMDNDGDLLYDEADPDCSTASATPGEASVGGDLTVTAHDPVAGTLTVSYGPACAATDHTLEFGPLSAVATYGYSGQDCALGISGSHTWSYGVATDSRFFLIVANDGSAEGSYGLDGAGSQRPEDSVSTTCPVPQDLSQSCDP